MQWRTAAGIVVWGLCAPSAVAAVLAHVGWISPTLDVLTHFAPVYVGLGAAGALLAAVLPSPGRWAAFATGALSVLAALVLMAPELLAARNAPPPAPANQQTFKIIQFNALTSNASLAAVDWLVRQDADVIVLEEGRGLAAALKSRGYNAACSGCGAVIFSRQRPIWSAGFAPRDARTLFLGAAVYRTQHGDIPVIGAHLRQPIRPAAREREAARLAAYVSSFPKARMIVAGDFNVTPWSFALRRQDRALNLVRRTLALPSWPAGRLSHNPLPAPFAYLPIDHVYAGPGWVTVKVERGPELGSDHYPVVVTLAPAGSILR